jgi:hypothetical protein
MTRCDGNCEISAHCNFITHFLEHVITIYVSNKNNYLEYTNYYIIIQHN